MTPTHSYGVYGVALTSDFPVDLPSRAPTPLGQVSLSRAQPGAFDARIEGVTLTKRDGWFEYAHLDDGASYVRWLGLGEFLVAEGGGEIACAKADDALEESFQVYLLGQALSFALVKAGFEPIHGTVIVHEGAAIALLGDSGYGKSTLAASFLAAGARLLTDDLLLIRREGGALVAYPGPARLKLLPDAAERFLPGAAQGAPMNALTGKRVIPLEAPLVCPDPTPLRAVFALPSPVDDAPAELAVTAMSPREGFVALVANTFNRYVVDPARLGRQLVQTAELSRTLPVMRLAYPRGVEHLAEVRAAILAAAARSEGAEAA